LKEERGSLWFRVLLSRFGEGSLFFRADDGRDSVWGLNLVSNGCGVVTVIGNWIDDNCVC